MENDVLSLAALVAAYVGVVKAYGVPAKHSPAIALAVAAVLVLVPDAVREKIYLISTIGLGATGAYSLIKKRDGGKNAKSN